MVGQDNRELAPWGPAVAETAPAYVQAEARHMALGTFAQAVRNAGLGQGVDVRLQAAATGAGTQSDSNLGFAIPREVAPGIEREMFGSGTRLFEGLEGEHISLEIIEVIQTAEAIHMRFRVVK